MGYYFQEYIKEVYLKLPDAQQEDEYKFKELLKNEVLDEEIKVKIIEKVETSISELKDLKSLPIKKALLEIKKYFLLGKILKITINLVKIH